MAGQSYAMFGWSLTEVSVLGSQVFGQALMESCGMYIMIRLPPGFWKAAKLSLHPLKTN